MAGQMLDLVDQFVRRYSVGQLEGDLVDPVKLLLLKRPFSSILLPGQKPDPDANVMLEAERTVRRLAELSPKIEADIRNVQEGDTLTSRLGADELPMLNVARHKESRVRFVGAPSGNLFEGLLEAIRRASTGDNDFSADLLRDLGNIGGDVHLRVFVTPACPACRPAIKSAHGMAFASPRVRADVIDATAFVDLAKRFEVYGVPTIVLNDSFSVGRISEDNLLEIVLHAADPSGRTPDIPFIPFASCGRL